MSDGGIGATLSYWATINIRGNLTSDQLKKVVQALTDLLNAKVTKQVGDTEPVVGRTGDEIDGIIRNAARLANTSEPEVTVTLLPPKPRRSP